MQFPQRFSDLPEYAFPRLRALLDGHAPGGDVVHMTIGEPRHAPPAFVAQIIADHADEFTKYPNNNGTDNVLTSIAAWIARRYGAQLEPETQIMLLNGTREGLFNACLALCPETKNGQTPLVLMPNPFYQVYAVATLTAAATPMYLPAEPSNGFLPDFTKLPATTLDQTAIAYICSPSNPQGGVADLAYWKTLLDLAQKHDFRVFADECYSEIYRDTAPIGALEAAHQLGTDPERVLSFNSLSKRSNLPGLRAGFVAGGPKSIAEIRKLRAYAGAPIPGPLQQVAAATWADEQHVNESRAQYRDKYKVADEVFDGFDGYHAPEAGFFLWLNVGDGEAASLKIWQQTGVRTLPGKYLSRNVDGHDPGAAYLRVAMVAPIDEMRRGLTAIRNIIQAP